VQNKKCVYCGVELPVSSQLHKRKYCSKSCSNKYKWRIKKPDCQEKLWQHEAEVFERAMELYWCGLGGAEIARHFAIPAGTVYSWIHDFGGQKERVEPAVLPEVMRLKSPKERFRAAKSADEWLEVLRDNTPAAEDSFEDLSARLVCGVIHGQSVSKLSTVIYESLKENPLSGMSYAFCNKRQNTITVLAWKAPVFNISRYMKAYGTFIWPHENLGTTIEVTNAEFDRLLFLKKCEKSTGSLDTRRFSCYN
jgi:transposase-like protein